MTRPADRAARLTRTRNLKMARSAHAYVRGSTANFYAWLEGGPADVPEGPPVWICGDCHLGNLGPLADAKGRVAVQIRDLDQTVIGNPAHDLIRLGLSLASAARGSDLPGVATARILERLMSGYEAALAGPAGEADAEVSPPPAIARLLNRSVRRRWRHLAEERLETVEPVIPLGKRFWALTRAERAGLAALFAEDGARAMITALKSRDAGDAIAVADAAYWMKGCSSLGRLRYAVMLKIGDGEGASFCLVDIKEAAAADAPRSASAVMPRDNAARVVAGAKALSPHLGERMLPARLEDRAVVLRELMPQDLKLEVGALTPKKAAALSAYLAGVVGRAHGRQMTAETRADWSRDLKGAKTRDLDAPGWLWTSVVSLLGIHEAAYLEHCRRFVLAKAA